MGNSISFYALSIFINCYVRGQAMITQIRKANGKEYEVETKGTPTFTEIYPHINTDIIEIVSLGKSFELWVNEEGLLKQKPLNIFATKLLQTYYNDIGINHQAHIVGDVAIIKRGKENV